MVLLLKDVPDEAIVTILEFLRATDLAVVSEVDKTVFSKLRVQRAVRYQLTHLYAVSYAGTPIKEKRSLSFDSPKAGRSLSFDSVGGALASTPSAAAALLDSATDDPSCGCDVLYVRGVKCILAALQSPQPITGKGYWISTSWMANAKKFYEALPLPELGPPGSAKKSGAKKQSKIRQRRGSDALPPWPSMTADITCAHGGLALTKGARSKKRLIDGRAWYFLRKFYPEGPQFKSTRAVECPVCALGDEEAKASVSEKREAELRSRRSGYVSGPLEAVAMRKSGVPSHLTAASALRRVGSPLHVSEETWLAMVSSSPQSVADVDTNPSLLGPFMSPVSKRSGSAGSDLCASVDTDATAGTGGSEAGLTGQPLLPGLYNLVPKQWLKAWRQFTKDPTVTALPPLDCTCLLCHTHGQLVIPPHFEEYIVGLKRSLLGGLGAYEGEVFEVLSAEEWDALQHSLRGLSDFSVRFCLDGDGISWNVGVCLTCDPFNYGPKQAVGDGPY
jgi:hypothetical protein